MCVYVFILKRDLWVGIHNLATLNNALQTYFKYMEYSQLVAIAVISTLLYWCLSIES